MGCKMISLMAMNYRRVATWNTSPFPDTCDSCTNAIFYPNMRPPLHADYLRCTLAETSAGLPGHVSMFCVCDRYNKGNKIYG